MGCESCAGTGYVLADGPSTARAALCRCSEECPECGGEGWLHRMGSDGYEVAVACGCVRLRSALQRFNRALIPCRYRGTTLDNFEPRTLANHGYLLDNLKRWLTLFESEQLAKRGAPLGLLFCGEPGVGKTHLAVGLLRELSMTRSVESRFVDFFDLLGQLKAGYDSGRGEAEILEPLTAVDVLVVDELGKGRSSEWERAVLDQLIGQRYNRSRTTIFTTNYPLRRSDRVQEPEGLVALESIDDVSALLGAECLEDRVGKRAYSRILEMCKPIVLRGASDYRLRRFRDGAE